MRTRVIAVLLVLVIVGSASAGFLLIQSLEPRNMGPPNPCGQVYQGQGLGEFVECKGLLLTETSTFCSLSEGSCTMTFVNNETSRRLSVVSTGCDVTLPVMVNGSGADRSVTVMDVEGINGGVAASGVQSGSQSTATCWFPTNEYMTNDTVQGISSCYTFAQAGNLTNTVQLCSSYEKWSLAPAANPPLNCPALVSNLAVVFNSVNVTVGQVTITNTHSYGVWISRINDTATVGPLGIYATGPYVGDSFTIPQNEMIAAKSIVMLALPGVKNTGQQISYTISYLPTNESITYTQPCSVTYQGTYPATTG